MIALNAPLSLEFAQCTDTGRVRPHNEDAVFIDAHQRLAILADGMGGYNAGEVASAMAVLHISRHVTQSWHSYNHSSSGTPVNQVMSTALLESIRAANTAIHTFSRENAACHGMGTTVVTALFIETSVIIAHIGDSRCYRLRGRQFSQLTHDHSLLQEQLDRKEITAEAAHFSPNKHILTRALGVAGIAEIELSEHSVEEGDIYLLCSDGLTDATPEIEIMRALEVYGNNAQETAQQLVSMANNYGGRDNTSVIIAKVGKRMVDSNADLTDTLPLKIEL